MDKVTIYQKPGHLLGKLTSEWVLLVFVGVFYGSNSTKQMYYCYDSLKCRNAEKFNASEAHPEFKTQSFPGYIRE